MKRRATQNRILALVLLLVLMIGCMVQPTSGKYVLTDTGRAMTSVISANVFTDVFVVTNSDLENGSATSGGLYGILQGDDAIDLTNLDGSYTVPSFEDEEYDDISIKSSANVSFVVKNNSDFDLIACFDVVVCMGLLTGGTLTCTITETTSGEGFSVNAGVNVSDESGIKMKLHKEFPKDTTEGAEDPVIDVQISNYGVDYKAYSFSVDPTDHCDSDILNNFILVKSGETKTFTFDVDLTHLSWGGIIGELFFGSKNCYASMTMTAKIYDPKAE